MMTIYFIIDISSIYIYIVMFLNDYYLNVK